MTRKILTWATAIAAALGLAACGSSSSSGSPAPPPSTPSTCTPPAVPTATFRDDVYPILMSQCVACHGDNQSSRPKLASADPEVAYSAAKAEVDPSNATSSPLVVLPNGANGHPDALSDAQTATIVRWIEECAQDNARNTTTTTTMTTGASH
jgi:cytochrome c5